MIDEEFRAQKCAEKTEKGNVFSNHLQAEARAANLSHKKGKSISAYQCLHCRLWHVGNTSKRRRKHPVRRGKKKGQLRI